MSRRPSSFTDARDLADAVIDQTGGKIVLGLPLGLGKANLVVNALYARVAEDPALSLKIVTALTLETPHGVNDLHRRFIEPVAERLFAGYPELDYARARRKGTLPSNIEVIEFFLLAGRWLNVPDAQQDYISTNYTHAAEYVMAQGVNVVAHLVAKGAKAFSLSCNPDVTPDLLEARKAGACDFLLVGQVNDKLPFMEGDAAVAASDFSHILDGPDISHTLYGSPKLPVSLADHAMGLHIARLIPDGGTLQIGIGSIGDAVAHALILRHRQNDDFRSLVRELEGDAPSSPLGSDAPFDEGLYGLSEMFIDSFLDLMDADILKRAVDGVVLHAAFFIGTEAFYQRLRDMSDAERRRIAMKPVSWVNALFREEEEKRAARVKARFVNNAMMVTLLGAVVSDGLEDGRVVSGVGGQHDFIVQSFALDGARSIIALGATRESGGKTHSNIRWSYGNQTIPRHLRDIIVTEYGVADLRGKTDAQVIAAMLSVTDSRFQGTLLDRAKAAGKIPRGFKIPDAYRNNTPERIAEALGSAASAELLPPYPFGTDFTDVEQTLILALDHIKRASGSKTRLASLVLGGLTGVPAPGEHECLDRMKLARPGGLSERVSALLVKGALRSSPTT
ncbi:MAG: acetyl-CoA hydrolase [Hyphomicrobiaceae bacterium]|nr:acetyl-CoA hydrolase [Hyphomicrobiaceae bacterium]